MIECMLLGDAVVCQRQEAVSGGSSIYFRGRTVPLQLCEHLLKSAGRPAAVQHQL